MAEDDFGIESLAAYLHVDPAQVLRLAERGKLPGRKVAGQWRFAHRLAVPIYVGYPAIANQCRDCSGAGWLKE